WSPDFWEFFGETAYLEEAFRVGLMRGFGGLFPLTKPLLAEGNLLVRSPAFLNGFRRGLVSLGRSLDDERFLFLDIDIATVIERAQQRGRPGEQDRSREQMEAIRRESLALASRFEIITTNDQGAVKLNQWLSVAK
ncbi:MAG: hypothetical protein KDA80_21255, partial [Planctomycetaceae bacterium]|nr:hypothetical protein [Planctomycetaceae bacterium]